MNYFVALILVLLVTIPYPAIAHEGHNEAFSTEGSAASSSSSKPIQVDAEGQKAIGLKVQAVRTGGLDQTLQTTGKVQAAENRASDINAPVAGVVRQVLVKQGDWVSKGQTLATIHSPEIAQTLSTLLQERARVQAEIATTRTQAQRDIAVQSNQVELTRANFQREQTLLSEGITAGRDFLEAQSAYRTAQAELDATRRQSAQQITLLQRQLGVTTSAVKSQLRAMGLPGPSIDRAIANWGVTAQIPIVSPVSGFITFRDITLGASVDPAKRIFSIVNLSPIWVVVDVFQEQIPQIRTGQQVRLQTAARQTIQGEISSIGTVVNPDNRTLPVRIVSSNVGGLLKPGMFVKAEIVTGQSGGKQIVVPSSAVIEENGQTLVYVKEGNTFQPVYVRIGSRTSETLAVQDGLFPGDLVVIQGAKQLYAQRVLGAHEAGETDEHSTEENSPGSDLWLGIGIGLLVAGAGIFAWYLLRKRPRRV